MPKWDADLRARLAGLQLTPAREAEIIEELSQHLDDRYEELRASGSSDADARRIALEELSETGALAQRMRTLSQAHAPAPIVHGQASRRPMHGLLEDLRHAGRTMRKQPGFTAIVVLTLGLGIAVNATVFTIVNALVLRPLPFEDSDRIVQLNVWNPDSAENPISELSYPDFQEWQSARRTFEQIAATDERPVDISGDQRSASVAAAAYVSWNTFSLVGHRPEMGRDFTEADDRSGAPPVVVISGTLWRVRYGADPAIVGRTVRVNGIPSTIVGVMPQDVGFPYRAEIWLPLAALSDTERTSRATRILDGFGRLRGDATIEQATTELSGITASLAERYPDTNRKTAPFVGRFALDARFVRVLIALLGTVGFVLLIACANVANLLLARSADRSRDVTLRLALGASRWRIVRQLLVEGLVLAVAGGVCGFALAQPGLQMFRNLPAESAPPSWVQFTMDVRVFAYLLVLCVGSALVCSLLPAWQASRPGLVATLNDAARGSTGGRSRRRWMGTLVVAQVALALVLLTGAAMMMQNLLGLLRTDVGVETRDLTQMALDLRRRDYDDARRLLIVGQLEDRLSANPGISAALASSAPLGGAAVRRLRIEGQSGSEPANLPVVSLIGVGRNYFDVVATPVMAGRALTAAEVRQAVDLVVVNDRFARMHFQDGSAVGKRILLLDPNESADTASDTRWMTIVGVVGNVRQRRLPSGEFDPVVYRSYRADSPQTMEVMARSTSGPSIAAAFVGEQVRSLDADLPLLPAMTVDEALARQLWPQRLFGSMFAAFASIAMLLATCGLYGVTAFAVSRRTREIGVRVALGADTRAVWWAITGTTLRQLAIGLVLGAAGAAAIATILPAMLVGTGGGANLLAFTAVAVVLVAAGVAASALPARRALRLDPTIALQSE
jgi:putative ABC transport system permease protein